MHHSKNTQTRRTSGRTPSPGLSPYVLDEVGLTLGEIVRARAADDRPVLIGS